MTPRKLITLFCLFFLSFGAFSQTVLYTLKPGEKIIMTDEHKLLSFNKSFYHLLFTERAKKKFVIFNGKEFGPFQEIQFEESNVSLLDWAVMKDSMWYQLILDKGLLVGPYEYVIDVYRNYSASNPAADQQHFGFRARKPNGEWIVNIDGKEIGPFPSLEGGYPQFSADGTNWVIEWWNDDEKKHYLQTATGKFSSPSEFSSISFWNNKLQYASVVYKGSFVFRSDSVKIGTPYRGSSSSIGCAEGKVNSQSYYVLEVHDESGAVLDTYDDLYLSGGSNRLITGVRYSLFNGDQPVKLEANEARYPDLFTKGCSYKDVPTVTRMVKNWYIKQNEKEFGPFQNLDIYGTSSGFTAGKFAAVEHPKGQLILDGKPSGITGVNYISYNSNTASTLCYMKNGEVYFNQQKLPIKDEHASGYFADLTDNFTINYQKNNANYLYISATKSSIGPLTEVPNVIISNDGKHWGYCQARTIRIDGQVKAQNAFELVFDSAKKSFKWITVKERQIMLNEFKTP